MTDELVKRLRGWAKDIQQGSTAVWAMDQDLKEAAARIEQLTAERDKYESAWMTAEGKLEDAVQGLEKCQEELDAYSRQEYPLDHTVHERYRQRDYAANPARITLAALKGETL